MSKDLEILDSDDVISVIEGDENRFVCGDTFRVEQLYHEYKTYVAKSNASISNKDIFKKHINCKVLRQNRNHKGWIKGKIKFIIAFEPDLVESNESSNSLDDIRKELDTTT
jgi:KGK domain